MPVAINFKLETFGGLPFRSGRAFWCLTGNTMLKHIDIPPLWLVAALAASWGLSRLWSVAGLEQMGMAVMGLGAGTMIVALWQMVRRRTTFIPRRDPAALVTGGIFRVSRNPIYLADTLILAGAILVWGAVLALPLIAGFMALITRRFVMDEEARLRAGFGAAAEAYLAATPRWIGWV